MTDTRTLLVPEGLDGERVDVALARLLGLTRSRVAELAKDGYVLVDDVAVPKSARLKAGSLLDVTLPAPRQPAAPMAVAGMRIVHDDADIVAIDKPVGVAAHSSPGWDGPTVVGALAAAGFRISTSGPPERKGIVQRLDVGTSGVMIVAKSERAYTLLKRAFRNREVTKIYHALVQGHLDPTEGTIDAPIGRDPRHTYKMGVTARGKEAITHYRTLELMTGATLAEVSIETGRTHQIRVHMAAVKHPCVGDTTYGADPSVTDKLGLTRQWLHAIALSFQHPDGTGPIEIKSEYPEDLAGALEIMRQRGRAS